MSEEDKEKLREVCETSYDFEFSIYCVQRRIHNMTDEAIIQIADDILPLIRRINDDLDLLTSTIKAK